VSEANPQERLVKGGISRAVKTARARNNHIARLQERNRVLAEMLAEERELRCHAYKWYIEKLNSKFWMFWAFAFFYNNRYRL
jgi:hypothetical protein